MFKPAGFTDIKMLIAKVHISETGKVDIGWPQTVTDGFFLEDASICDTLFAQGKTQKVYQVMLYSILKL